MDKNRRPAAGQGKRLLRAGWIFLGLVILLAIAAIIFLVPERTLDITQWEPRWSQSDGTAAGGAAGAAGRETVSGGQNVAIDGILCSFTPPAELTLGVIRSVDMSAAGETVCAAVRAAGWGDVVSSLSGDGSLLFYLRDAAVLPGDKYEAQTAFLASDRPEALARVFLTDSGLYDLLGGYGITLSLTPENNGGEIVFTGSSGQAGSQCRLRMNFLYDGSLNQVRLYAVYLADAVTTQAVVPLESAAANALSWSSAGAAPTQVTAVEIRSVNGIPLYVLDCADGSTAYALAVEDEALAASPGALAVYESMLQNGIQEYVPSEGAGY